MTAIADLSAYRARRATLARVAEPVLRRPRHRGLAVALEARRGSVVLHIAQEEMTPAEARDLAATLCECADDAEARR